MRFNDDKPLQEHIRDMVILAARENARETVQHTFNPCTKTYGPEIQAAYVSSVQSIRDALQSPRESWAYSPRTLTEKQAHTICDPLIKNGY